MQSFLFETATELTIDLPGYPSVFSPCGRYRYTSWRVWNPVADREKGDRNLLCEAPFGPFRQKVAVPFSAGPRLVMWVLLHPSAAEADDEATIGGRVEDSRAWGFDGMCVCNLFAFRAADAETMKAERDAVGDDNDYWLVRAAEHCERIVCDWGGDGAHQHRDRAVMTLFRSLGREADVELRAAVEARVGSAVPSPSGRGLG